MDFCTHYLQVTEPALGKWAPPLCFQMLIGSFSNCCVETFLVHQNTITYTHICVLFCFLFIFKITVTFPNYYLTLRVIPKWISALFLLFKQVLHKISLTFFPKRVKPSEACWWKVMCVSFFNSLILEVTYLWTLQWFFVSLAVNMNAYVCILMSLFKCMCVGERESERGASMPVTL